MTRELLHRRQALDAARSAFDSRAPLPRDLASDVSESWRRCASSLPVGRTAPVELEDSASRWDESPIRRAAPDLVDELARLAVSEDYVVAVTDPAGRIIWSAAGRSMARLAERAHFVGGANWDETVAGTNAPGLAVRTGRPATVFATEHWCEIVRDWVCYAAPVRGPTGELVGVIDLSSTWQRASPFALATVTATARLIEQQLAAEPPAPAAELQVGVLGHPSASLRGEPVHFSLRQLEILTTLAVRGGLGREELHDLLYGERRVADATLKAEISHLRHLLGGAIASRPYRLSIDVAIDVVDALAAVRRGALDVAVRLYRGQLLPASESPFVIDLRHHLDASLRTALLRGGRLDGLLAYADVHPFDLEVLERAAEVADPTHPSYADVVARGRRALG
jgi:hypothetical protein